MSPDRPIWLWKYCFEKFFNAKTVYYFTQMSNVHKVIFIAKVCGHFQLWQVLSNGFQDFNRQFYTVVMLLTFILIIISILSQWQWHQLGHMQVCTSLQTDNHASTPPLSFYRPDALPAAQPTVSKHWRHKHYTLKLKTLTSNNTAYQQQQCAAFRLLNCLF